MAPTVETVGKAYIPGQWIEWKASSCLGLPHRSIGGHILMTSSNRGLELSVPSPDLWGRERDLRLNQSPGTNDFKYAYVINCPQSPKGWSSESFWVGEHVKMWGDWCSQTVWKLCSLLHTPSPLHFFHLVVSEPYPFIVKWWSSR